MLQDFPLSLIKFCFHFSFKLTVINTGHDLVILLHMTTSYLHKKSYWSLLLTWVKLFMWLKIRRLGPPFIPHKLSFTKREVPPLSKNKTSENWFHLSEGPNPVGRCRPTALPSFNRSKVLSSVCWVSLRTHVLLYFCQSPDSAFNTPLLYNTKTRTLIGWRDREQRHVFLRWRGAWHTWREALAAPPALPALPQPRARPQRREDVARSSLRPSDRRAHHCTHRARLRLPRRLPLGGQSSQLPHPLLSD